MVNCLIGAPYPFPDARPRELRRLVIAHTLPRGSRIGRARLDGKRADYPVCMTNRGLEVLVRAPARGVTGWWCGRDSRRRFARARAAVVAAPRSALRAPPEPAGSARACAAAPAWSGWQ
jgi:hypothetical protein